MLGVIGAGPIGAIVALRALENGEDVILFDIGADENRGVNSDLDANESKKFAVKTHNGLGFPYDFNQYLRITSTNFHRKWFTSKSKGGFSVVWGGTWGRFVSLKDQTWQSAYSFVETKVMTGEYKSLLSADFYCECFVKMKESISRHSNFLNSNEIVTKLSPILSASSTKEISGFVTWDANILLRECMKFEGFHYKDSQFITTIESTQSIIRISNKEITQDLDQLILAAGPIGNSAILLRNGITPRSFVMSDTQMIYVPFLYRINKGVGFHQYPYSQISIDLGYGNAGRMSHIQLYGHLDLHLQRYLPKSLPIRNIMVIFFRFISRFLGVALIYMDPEDSDKISLEWGAEELLVRKIPNRYRSRAVKEIKMNFKIFASKTLLFPIWTFMKQTEVGESYHLGSVGNGVVDNFGRLLSDNRIGVAGSFALDRLESGPITMTAMAQGVRLVEKMFEALPKFGEKLPDLD
jgi:hypothetical protein